MTKLLKQLRKNRAFRLCLTGVKLFTLFLFGICLVSFLSALTQLFNIRDLYVKKLMFWGMSLILAGFAVLCIVILAIALYEYMKTAKQRRKQDKSEAQVEAFEQAKAQKEAHGDIETHYPGYLGAQDTLHVSDIAGIGDIYQQTFVDTYTRVAIIKIYDSKTALLAADLLNDRVLPFFRGQGVRLLKILTDWGPEYCGSPEQHEYQRYLAIEAIDHAQTKVPSPPQGNGVCERFHQEMVAEFYEAACRQTRYQSLNELQRGADRWVDTLQLGAIALGAILLRQNANADVCRQSAVGQR